MRKAFILFIFGLYFAGCTPSANTNLFHYEIPPDWKDSKVREESITKYSESLRGKKIFIDPGHGGEDRKNKGRNGLTCEADANLKVSLALRDYLTKAGATVYMSREKDMTVGLKERSVMANKSDADIFISIHHNAPGSAADNWTDYTSTYYHAKETDYEYEPCQRDMARYVQRDLSYVMDNSGGLGSFDGTYSDYWIYPDAGFSVLRLTEKPSILLECGFFTNDFEERRLALDEFNQIQAWGIFRGLSKYFKAGIPEIIPLATGNALPEEGDITLSYLLKDKKGIDPKSIEVYFDSLQTGYNYDPSSNSLTVNLTGVKAGNHEVRVVCRNTLGNHSFPFRRRFAVNPALLKEAKVK